MGRKVPIVLQKLACDRNTAIYVVGGRGAMTTPQILSFAVIGAMMAAFIWGRFRYDVVAAVGLLLAVAVGVVPFENAFTGFADDIVIIVGSALVVSAAVSRSGIVEIALQRFAPNLSAPRVQLIVLVTSVALLSAFVK